MADENSSRNTAGANLNDGRRSADDDDTSLQDLLTTLFSLSRTGGAAHASGGSNDINLSGITLQDLALLMEGRQARIGPTSGGRGARIVVQDDEGNQAIVEEEEEDMDEDEEEEEDDDDDDVPYPITATPHTWFPPVREPQKEGLELLASGDFGQVGIKNRTQRKSVNIIRSILDQRTRSLPVFNKEDIHSNLVPNCNGTTVATYDYNMYTASFSNDSSFYYTCSQDFKLHIFDMTAAPAYQTNPRRIQHDSGLVTRMALRKVIQGHPGRWTITDANLSPDNERMIYSSITPTVYMTSTAPDGNTVQIPIPFSDPYVRSYSLFNYGDGFGIYSCRFSADGNEVVAGGSGKIFVYDLLANRRTIKIPAHDDDVNSCCWADTGSGNVLVSASDDTFLKVWDRRSLGASNKPSGVLIGHTEGITYVSAKGDGRYIISNGKDQALRLWDLRKMRTSAEHEAVQTRHYGVNNFDYRYPNYPKPRFMAHPKDCSVMTYRGHSVLRTLIRCHFSPAETTGSQYIYSGSADGRVHIWSLDGRIVQVLDRSKTLPSSFSPSGPEPPTTTGVRSKHYCVRDVSWHTQEPVILSAGWDDGTVIARHEYKGISKASGALEDWVEKNRLEAAHTGSPRRSTRLQQISRRRSQHIPGAFYNDDEDEF